MLLSSPLGFPLRQPISAKRFCFLIFAALSCITILIPTSVYAGSYGPAQYSGGTFSYGSSSTPYTLSGRYGAGGGYGPDELTCSGTITTTFTWQPNPGQTLTTDPPPKYVIVTQMCEASWDDGDCLSPVSATGNNGLGVPQVTTGPTAQGGGNSFTFYSGSGASGVNSSGGMIQHVSMVSGGAVVTLTCSPFMSIGGGSSTGDYGEEVYYLAEIGGNLIKLSPAPGTGNPNGGDPTTPVTCTPGAGIGGLNALIDGVTGNAYVNVNDPIATRGYPLTNTISLSSQTAQGVRSMGNATFSYDIHVTTGPIYTQSGTSTTDWLLVDGTGTRLDFGPTSSAPSPVGAVFCHLATIPGSGYTVTGAGPPGDISQAGNFSYQFNSAGQLTQITDPQGNVQSLSYANGHLVSVTDQSTGHAITFSYTGSLISQIIEGNGAEVTQLGYTGNDLSSIEVTNGNGTVLKTIAFSYDASGLLASIVRDGQSSSAINFTYTYMPDANPADTTGIPMANYRTAYNNSEISWSSIQGSSPTLSAVQLYQNGNSSTGVQYNQNSSGQLTSTVTPVAAGGGVPLAENFSYNGANQVTSYTDGFVNNTYSYASNGLMTSYTDSLGNEWLWNYNGVDLTSSQTPTEKAAGVSETWAYADPSQPNVATGYTDAAGNTWSYGHNGHGQITSVTPPAGSPEGVSTYTYDESLSDATLGYLMSSTDGAGDVTTYNSYDALGDLTSISTYPNGTSGAADTTLYSYDAAQRLTQVTEPDGKTETYAYTGRNLTSTTDEAGTTYNYSYCETCGMMDGITGPGGWSLSWGFGPDHQLESFTDANGNKTTYTYGNANELDNLLYPDGSGFSYLYNNQQQISQVTNGRGDDIDLGYDGDERLSSVTFPTTNQPSIRVGYDPDGRVQSFSDGIGTTSYTYAINGWLTKVVYNYSASGLANAQEIDYSYYPDGKRESMTWKSGGATVGTWTYTYDTAGRLNSVTNPWNETTNYSYDGESKLLSQTDANGMSVAYAYNNATGWPSSITDTHNGAPFASYALTYDNGANTVGNLTGVTDLDGSTTAYGYDSLYRLTSENRTGTSPTSQSFSYDLAGNPTSINAQSFTYDSANKLTNSGYTYDGDGDLLSDGTSSYTWDDRGDMTSRSAGGTTETYGYNAEGLRVESSANGGTFYIFDGSLLLGEISASGTVNAAYTWGASGLVSERVVPSSQSFFYAFGPQGETRELTNSAGAVVDTYSYTAYGVPVSETGSDANPFRFGGQFGYYTDAAFASDSLLCGQRWYEPSIGRWISRDPSGYGGGSDLYKYCFDDPANLEDESGNSPVCIQPLLQFTSSPVNAPSADPFEEPVENAADIDAAGGGPEDPFGDVVAGTVLGIGLGNALGDVIGNSLYGPQTYPGYGPDPIQCAHKKGARPSTEEDHQRGASRTRRDQGGEKSDVARRNGVPNRRPEPTRGPVKMPPIGPTTPVLH